MRKETNLDKVKEVALMFLYLPVEETEYSPIVVMHPIFESALIPYNDNGNFTIGNILEDETTLEKATSQLENRIKSASDIIDIYVIVRKSYKLTFLKYIKNYVSVKDFSSLLADAWITSENPNQDVNVSVATLASWFKHADKETLMCAEDYEVYKALPETITVYRGITPGHNPKGLSWTQNLKTAQWFANRFGKGYIQKATINKSQALAYFNTRNEDEIVVDTRGLEFEIIDE